MSPEGRAGPQALQNLRDVEVHPNRPQNLAQTGSTRRVFLAFGPFWSLFGLRNRVVTRPQRHPRPPRLMLKVTSGAASWLSMAQMSFEKVIGGVRRLASQLEGFVHMQNEAILPWLKALSSQDRLWQAVNRRTRPPLSSRRLPWAIPCDPHGFHLQVNGHDGLRWPKSPIPANTAENSQEKPLYSTKIVGRPSEDHQNVCCFEQNLARILRKS